MNVAGIDLPTSTSAEKEQGQLDIVIASFELLVSDISLDAHTISIISCRARKSWISLHTDLSEEVSSTSINLQLVVFTLCYTAQ